jgi:hypothetical protein
MNEKLFGIDGKGCDAEIMISLGVVGKCSKGKTEHNKVMFEVGGELNHRSRLGAQTGTKLCLNKVMFKNTKF